MTDISGVVSRGLGAAIVVFLAAYGGLAVFAAADAEPNAYLILFICLVGAIFSDKVWKWAQERLGGWLGGENLPKNGGGGGSDKTTPS